MNATESLALIALVGVATYAMRAGMILTLADRALPEPLVRALRNVGPAVLAALVVTLVADPDQARNGVTLAEVAGLTSACLVAFRSRSLVPSLAAGMLVFWLIRWVG
jgi:branched-subunit amino acid transport protein